MSVPEPELAQTRYKMTMGLQPMQPDDWIEIDEDYQEEMLLRQQLVRQRRDIVLASQPQVCTMIRLSVLPQPELSRLCRPAKHIHSCNATLQHIKRHAWGVLFQLRLDQPMQHCCTLQHILAFSACAAAALARRPYATTLSHSAGRGSQRRAAGAAGGVSAEAVSRPLQPGRQLLCQPQ